MSENEERKVLLSYPSLETAELVRDHLTEEMRIAADHEIEIEEQRPACNNSLRRGTGFALTVSPYFYSFSTSVEKCRNAARDFLLGLNKGLSMGLERVLHGWRGTLRTRTTNGISPIKWADPVGRAAGLTCKRVGKDQYGTHYIRVWNKEDPKGRWVKTHSDSHLEEMLAREDVLPWPHWLREDVQNDHRGW